MKSAKISTKALQNAAKEFDRISRAHYGRPLPELLADVDSPLGRKQFARLIGVMIKEPFAKTKDRRPSKATKAVKVLDWKSEKTVRKLAPGTWQFEFIRQLSRDEKRRSISDREAIDELLYYQRESSLGKAVFQAFRARICDPKTSAVVRAAVAEAKKSGVKLIDPTTASLSVGVASVVAVAVASVLPAALAAAASPVIGGIALLLIQVGVEGFCTWSKEVIDANASPQGEEEL